MLGLCLNSTHSFVCVQFHVERDADGGSDLSDQPASVSGDALTQHKLQLQKMEDDKLLTGD